jgi:RHS repeat-associated protein
VSNSAGTVTSVNTYDEYGKPGSGNVGRFQYTGQKWIAELGLYDYKARMYHPGLGRFVQPDPIGYDGGMNLYAYVRGNPVNKRDHSGLSEDDDGGIVVTGSRCPSGATCFAPDEFLQWASPSQDEVTDFDAIVVRARSTKKLGKNSLHMHSGREEFYRVTETNEFVPVRLKQEVVDCGNGLEVVKNTLPNDAIRPSDTRAVHTHGFTGPLTGIPGPGDALIPLRYHIPLYGITNYGVFKISPAGTGIVVSLIDGSWGPGGENFSPSAYARSGNSGTKSSNTSLCKASGN